MPLLKYKKSHFFYAFIYLLPTIILYSIFYYYPFALNIYYSFTDWDFLHPPSFIGLKNYQRLISDPLFFKSLILTVIYVISVLLGSIAIGLIQAFIINRPTKLAAFTRVIMFIPYMIPDVAAAAIWLIIFAPGPSGYANCILSSLGLGNYSWFQDPNLAMSMLIFYSLWKYTGFSALVLYSGIKAIPGEYIEAARIDGASEFKVFTRVIMPLLGPIISFIIATNLMSSWFVFSSVYTLTKGGPGTATLLIGMYLYSTAFESFKAGYASTIAIINTIFIIFIVILQVKRVRGIGYGV
jgi:multiple sugar transport system permease protein